MSIKYKYQNLHCHTTASDGELSHLEVLEVCSNNDIGVVAFTDHDNLMSEKAVKDVRANKKNKVEWISGIEMSAEEGHIVGLFVNPFDKNLFEHCKKAQAARVDRMEKMVKNLKSLGFDITVDACLKASKGEAVGRPHIVEALRSKRSNLKIIENLKNKMKKDAEKDVDLRVKYKQMVASGEEQYPYTLFLSDDSYIKDIYVDYLYRVDISQATTLIRGAQGLSFYAHWFTEVKKITPEILEGYFKTNLLDGVETVYGLTACESGYLTQNELGRQRKILQGLVSKYNKLESGGSDAHTKEQFKEFTEVKWYAKLTVGMIEHIVKKSGVDTSYSSLGNLL
jgi:hypothetical protein